MLMPALGLVAGCTTMRLEDTLPATTAAAEQAPAVAEASGEAAAVSYAPEDLAADRPPRRPATSGAYPNLNIRPATASEQLTEAERAESTRVLESTRERVRQQGGTPPPAVQSAEQIRRMARQREEETLRRIDAR